MKLKKKKWGRPTGLSPDTEHPFEVLLLQSLTFLKEQWVEQQHSEVRNPMNTIQEFTVGNHIPFTEKYYRQCLSPFPLTTILICRYRLHWVNAENIHTIGFLKNIFKIHQCTSRVFLSNFLFRTISFFVCLFLAFPMLILVSAQLLTSGSSSSWPLRMNRQLATIQLLDF